MAKRKGNSSQFKFSLALAAVTLFLVLGYFAQSFLEIRKVKPGRVAIERVIGATQEADTSTGTAQTEEKGDEEVADQ